MQIAKIAVSAAIYAIDRPYSYAAPQGMPVQPGVRVMVPFGRGNRMTEGIVLSVEEGNEAELKRVDQVLDTEPVLDNRMLRLAAFLRERYFCTFYEAIRVTLPAGLWFQIKDTYTLAPDRPWEGKTIRKAGAAQILELLENLGGSGEYQTIQKLIEDEDILKSALKYLIKQKWVTSQTDFLRRAGDKTERIAVLAASAEEVMEYAGKKSKAAPVQYRALEMLCKMGACSVKELCYYTGATAATFKRLEQLGYISLQQQETFRCRDIKPAELDGPLQLNETQENAFSHLRAWQKEDKPGVALLYGITGSGKTAVYIRLIQKTLEDGKSALLLVPEIGLTPQLLSLMAAYFGDQVAVLHSALSVGERYDQWKRIRRGDARVIVGTRSAVFAPSPDLGLLILDEEQEHSYKSEQSPRYCARETAIFRGQQLGALVVLGSATPSVETMYRAKKGIYRMQTLSGRYNGMELPSVQIVDMKQELRSGNGSTVSIPLHRALQDTLDHGEQAVLFLNRRGASRMVQCVNCGQVPECPRCAVHLTYHSANNRFMCHYCGFSIPASRRCPKCGGPLKPVGVGTQRVQQELEEQFPGIRVCRMDADTVSAMNTHEKILERFQSEKMNVLLGTQMVTKGLNLPNVTLVGVLDADQSLYISSYLAPESTFNMLTQVVGRAGRGDRPGQAFIQTMTPEHKVITLAARQDYDGFYDTEINMRKIQGCPPFGDLYTITFTGLEEDQVLRAAIRLRDSLVEDFKVNEALRECLILGPAPAGIAKINYRFRYRLTVRGPGSRLLRSHLAYFLRQFSLDRSNRGVSAYGDVNGTE